MKNFCLKKMYLYKIILYYVKNLLRVSLLFFYYFTHFHKYIKRKWKKLKIRINVE